MTAADQGGIREIMREAIVSDMDSSVFDSLTPRELDCLRLVHRGLESKEIASELAISVSRVDEIIASARGKLGGVRRRRAADLLWCHEQPPQPPPGWPMGGAEPSLIGWNDVGAQVPRIETPPMTVREERTAFDGFPAVPHRPDHLRNWLRDMDGMRRLTMVATLATLLALLILVAPLLAERLGSVGSALYQRQ